MGASQDNDDRGSGIVRTSARKAQPEQKAATTTESASPARQPSGLSAPQIVESGLRQIAELTGKEVVGVVSLKGLEDGWLVEIEAVEDRRVPSSSDLLAVYEAQLTKDGVLLGYSRKKRYARGWGDKGDGS